MPGGNQERGLRRTLEELGLEGVARCRHPDRAGGQVEGGRVDKRAPVASIPI